LVAAMASMPARGAVEIGGGWRAVWTRTSLRGVGGPRPREIHRRS
jgi:hypothetical protein